MSPLLANVYFHRFLDGWFSKHCDRAFDAEIVNYADDFVVLGRGHAEEVLAWIRRAIPRLGLSLNEEKTAVRDATREPFRFLGYVFGVETRGTARWAVARPCPESLARRAARLDSLTAKLEKVTDPVKRARVAHELRYLVRRPPVFRGRVRG